MIRDRLVVGLLDTGLSEKLQLDAELTLEKAVTRVRQVEEVKKQQSVLRSDSSLRSETAVGAVDRGKKAPKVKQTFKSRQRQGTSRQKHSGSGTCSRCGQSPSHDYQHCPAKDATCHKCNRKGHYQKTCWSASKVGEVYKESKFDGTGNAFLGAVRGVREDRQDPWAVKVQLNGSPVIFHIDTGAEVTVISEQLHRKLNNASLSPATRTLKGPGGKALSVKGQFEAQLQIKSKKRKEDVYVVTGLHKPLLGQPAIKTLNLLARVGAIDSGRLGRPESLFPHLFKGLGKMKGEYTIKLKEGAKPFALANPRRIAIPLIELVREELKRMESLGVISRIDQPTDWCAGLVVVQKGNGKVRLCVDLTKLNENVRRERHQLPAVEQTLAQIAGAHFFSKLDANSGFWQIPLDQESAPLTSFITPFGRYYFNRLPFGITSAPEHFQKRMSSVLKGLEGIVCLMDDVLVHGRTEQEHDERLLAALSRLQESGITLNREKCVFSRTKVKFLGQVLTQSGVESDPDKIKAIQKMEEPTSVSEVRRFLGMANQLSKFTPNLAELTKPLRDLLSKKNHWCWDYPQKEAFSKVKEALTESPVLALFDLNRETIVSADASSYGLGGVLLQKEPSSGEPRPVAYISRSMTPTEQRYAQIEKEALALTWACERFSDYLIGLHFHIETDHKPLVPLLSTKLMDELPLRVQRFRMRLMRYSFTIGHVPGKNLVIADTLSRAPTSESNAEDHVRNDEVDAYVQIVLQNLPATEGKLEEIRRGQEEDEICKEVITHCQVGWPDKKKLSGNVKQFYSIAAELSVENGLLLRAGQLVIPTAMRRDVLKKIHTGHQGITKCRERARQSVWWPGMSKELEEIVTNCQECIKYRSQRAEPLRPTPLPSLPWQKVGTDLFEWKKSVYLLIIDYYSRWIEVAKLDRPTADSVITHSSSIFARHGIPETVISDNGPQYVSEAYSKFAQQYGFKHHTSSPYHPQGNGEAERAVQTIKSLLKKSGDPYLALLAYRSTPLESGYSPSELLMGRRLRTTVPTNPKLLLPKTPDLSQVKNRDAQLKNRQKKDFDTHHGAQELSVLHPGDPVWVTDQQSMGNVTNQATARSYVLQTPNGSYRRNRRDIVATPGREATETSYPFPDGTSETPHYVETQSTSDDASNTDQSSEQTKVYRTRLRSGKTLNPPNRLDNSWM